MNLDSLKNKNLDNINREQEYLGLMKPINKLNPLVSVFVPTFNQERYITQCLDSILTQKTNFTFEIILGEDDSSDRTRQISIEYAEKHQDKIRLFLRDRKDVIFINGNATGRFNVLASYRAVRGKYIALCDGDDYWTDPYKLQRQFDFLEKNQIASGCFTDSYMLRDEHLEKIIIKEKKEFYDTIDLIIREWFIMTCTLMIRKTVTEKIPEWFNTITNGDYALTLLSSLQGPLGFISSYTGVYRKHTSGISNEFYSWKIIYRNLTKIYKNFNHHTNGRFQKPIKTRLRKIVDKIIVESRQQYKLFSFFYFSFIRIIKFGIISKKDLKIFVFDMLLPNSIHNIWKNKIK